MVKRRDGYGLFQLLIVLAILAMLLGLMLPAVQKVREAAARMQSANNLKQWGIAAHSFHDATNAFPPGVDEKHFSGFTPMLPYVEQDVLYKSIDLAKECDAAANNAARATRIKILENPSETADAPIEKAGPTSYFLVAGNQNDLERNNGVFFAGSKVRITDMSDGTSNTMMMVENLRGDGSTKATSVARQHIQLKKADLKGIGEKTGVKDFEDSKNVVGTRGGSWIDGRFLQSTTNVTRGVNDAKPDVDCGGAGGHAAIRTQRQGVNILMGDGSVRFVSENVKLETWKLLADKSDGMVIGDF